MIKEAYVSFEVAKLLKEKGFNEPCIATYNSTTKKFYIEELYLDWSTQWKSRISAPTHQMAMKWLREIHDIIVVVEPHMYDYINSKTSNYVFCLWYGDNYEEPYSNQHSNIHGTIYNSYEEAVEAALKYSLEKLI